MTTFDFVHRASQAAVARDELSGCSYWVNDRAYVDAFGAALDPAVADLVTIALVDRPHLRRHFRWPEPARQASA